MTQNDAIGAGAAGKSVLIIGASRGLGLALAEEFARRGWEVTGTVRGTARTPLHELAESSGGQVAVETVDINEPGQVTALRARLAGRGFGLLYVNAGIPDEDVTAAGTPAGTFSEIMVTNALSPMRVVETLRDVVRPDGTIAVMSSRQGSIALNERGGHEVYRASKSALNQLMRSYAARRADDPRTLLLIHPGWVQTGLGGPGATFTASDTIPGVVDTIEAHAGDGGLQFRDYQDKVVPW